MAVFRGVYVRDSVPADRASPPAEDVQDFGLAVSYLSASLEAMEMSDPMRGVLRQMLLMMDVMARKIESTRPIVVMNTAAKLAGEIGAWPSTVSAAPTPAPPAGLSPAPGRTRLGDTEIRVLACVGRGLSNEEIAQELGMKKASVATALNRAFGKLGAQRRYQAYRLAKEAGFVR